MDGNNKGGKDSKLFEDFARPINFFPNEAKYHILEGVVDAETSVIGKSRCQKFDAVHGILNLPFIGEITKHILSFERPGPSRMK